MKTTNKIYQQHEENKKWMNDISFYNDELKVLNKRLAEVAGANSSKEILAKVEHFQNQLIVQKDNLDRLKHAININNDGITAEINNNKTAVDHREIKDHSELRNNLESFTKIYQENKTDLNHFLGKHL